MKITCLPALRASILLTSPTPLLPLPSREGKKNAHPNPLLVKERGKYMQNQEARLKNYVPPPSGTSYHLLPQRGEGRNRLFTLHLKQNSRVG